MRVYFMSKKSLIRAVLLVVLISTAIVLSVPYKEIVISVFNPNRQIPIYSVDTPKRAVAITFDCAWGADDIPKIIELLEKYNIKATFFVVGDWVSKFPDKVQLLDKAGHEIANHSDTHPDMTGLNQDRIKQEVLEADKRIENLTGKKNILFRPPYGAYNNLMINTVKSLGHYIVQWDVDSLDWKDLGVKSIVDRINKKVKNGSIILFHNDTKYTLDALPLVFDNLKSQGYEFMKVSDLILKENFYIDNEGRQHTLIKESSSID